MHHLCGGINIKKENILHLNLFEIFLKIYNLRPMIYTIKMQKMKKINCAEIGVRHGKNAKNILKRLNIEKMYLIDPYLEYDDFERQHQIERDFDINKAENIARKKLERYEKKTVWLKEKSEDAVNKIKKPLDFVYIDGNHSYEYVLSDIELYWKKIKKGGFIGGHDFNNEFGVMRAVGTFAETRNKKINFYKCDWWIKK